MAGVNKVILIGNLGADPDVRYMQNGDAVANVSIATSETWRDKQTGERQERTEWHRVVFFGKTAETVKQYLHKGSKVYVEGKLRTRKWQTQEGQERYTTEVVVDMTGTMQMLDGRQGVDMGTSEFPGGAPAQSPSRGGSNAAAPVPGGQGGGMEHRSSREPDFDDDIPF